MEAAMAEESKNFTQKEVKLAAILSLLFGVFIFFAGWANYGIQDAWKFGLLAFGCLFFCMLSVGMTDGM